MPMKLGQLLEELQSGNDNDAELQVVIMGDEIEFNHPFLHVESVRFDYDEHQVIIETS